MRIKKIKNFLISFMKNKNIWPILIFGNFIIYGLFFNAQLTIYAKFFGILSFILAFNYMILYIFNNIEDKNNKEENKVEEKIENKYKNDFEDTHGLSLTIHKLKKAEQEKEYNE
jgi:hypothetical protein